MMVQKSGKRVAHSFVLQCWAYEHISIVRSKKLPIHSVHPDHPIWYWWTKHGKITWVHKTMEAYRVVMDDLMGGKWLTLHDFIFILLFISRRMTNSWLGYCRWCDLLILWWRKLAHKIKKKPNTFQLPFICVSSIIWSLKVTSTFSMYIGYCVM